PAAVSAAAAGVVEVVTAGSFLGEDVDGAGRLGQPGGVEQDAGRGRGRGGRAGRGDSRDAAAPLRRGVPVGAAVAHVEVEQREPLPEQGAAQVGRRLLERVGGLGRGRVQHGGDPARVVAEVDLDRAELARVQDDRGLRPAGRGGQPDRGLGRVRELREADRRSREDGGRRGGGGGRGRGPVRGRRRQEGRRPRRRRRRARRVLPAGGRGRPALAGRRRGRRGGRGWRLRLAGGLRSGRGEGGRLARGRRRGLPGGRGGGRRRGA